MPAQTQVVDIRPTSLQTLEGELKAHFAKAKFCDFQVRREVDSLRIETATPAKKSWTLNIEPDVWIWRFPKTKLRLFVQPFRASAQLKGERWVLRLSKGAETSLEAAFQDLRTKHRKPIQLTFLTRSLNAIAHLGEMEESVLQDAVAGPTDQSVIIRALQSPAALAPVRELDPSLNARLRSVAAKQELMQAFGGVWSAAEAAHSLGLTRQAIDKRRKKGQLLAVELGRRGYFYPAWQFTQSGTLSGLEEVLEALKDQDAWTQVAFFANPNARLESKSPVACLQSGETTKVTMAAEAFGEQGAA
jgi:hypothetical protein